MDQITFLFLNKLNEECDDDCTLPSENEMFIRIDIKSQTLALIANTDESYQLNITSSGKVILAQVQAETIFGARHGLETLSQLVTKRTDGMNRNGLVMIKNAQLSDKPIYQHRGLLVDTARHFIPMNVILRILDGMAATKLNVFHWHITDSQSFPMELKRVPQMHLHGAFSKDEVYYKSDIESVIKFAKYRGIRVILELDAPAHAGHGWTWGKSEGIGNLAVCVDDQPWRKKCIQPNCGQLNPSNHNLYKVLSSIYKDIGDFLEPDEFFHVGGDEVFIPCWNSSEEILSYMKTKNYNRSNTEGFLELWSEFQDEVLKLWDDARGKDSNSVIIWTSELTSPRTIANYLDKERYIIQTWVPNDSTIPADLLKQGYRLIISTKNAWYLDHGFWGITKFYNWKTVYQNKIPMNPLVLGGEACMWTEYCDEHSIEMRIWPRLNAVAERLWTNPSDDFKTVESRFHRQRERLIAKGIKVDSVLPEFCTLFEGECR